MNIRENLDKLYKEIPPSVKVVAITKTVSEADILEVYNHGQKTLGENKAQELLTKYAALPRDIEWHFVGHLQTNKIKFIAPFVKLIHSVDSLHLLVEINKEAAALNRVIDCLLQFHIADEQTKFGLEIEEGFKLLSSPAFPALQNVNVKGVMGMATLTEDLKQVRREFRNLHNIFNDLKTSFFKNNKNFCELSMGMTSDFKLAVDEGSTMIRIGSLIFGERIYNLNSVFSKRN